MKRLFSFFLTCLLMIGLLSSMPVSAAANLSVTATATTVTVGQNVTVTLKYDGDGSPIGGIMGNLTYDTAVFSYVSFSGSDVQVNGGAGKMRFIYSPTNADAPKTVSISFTFKSLTPGACAFAVTTEEFINDNDYSSLGSPIGSVTVTASNPTLSGNTDLQFLTPSKGTLTPKFDNSVTAYTVTVPYEVTSVSFSTDTVHPDAKVAISGKSAVKVGKNTRVLTITAPNGTTKEFTLTVIRQEATGTTGTTGTTQPTPPEDALDVEVGGNNMTILDTQAAVDLPDGFTWSNLTINRVDVPAAVHGETGMVLLYLTSANGENDGFYIYDAEEDTFTRYRPLQLGGGTYLLYDLPADQELKGMIRGMLDYEGGSVSAYVYSDPALSDFCVVWASSLRGEGGWYTYDRVEGTLQRHHSSTVVGDPVNATTTKPSKPVSGNVDEITKADDAPFYLQNQVLLIIGGVILVCLIVLVLIIRAMSKSGGKHKRRKH